MCSLWLRSTLNTTLREAEEQYIVRIGFSSQGFDELSVRARGEGKSSGGIRGGLGVCVGHGGRRCGESTLLGIRAKVWK